MMFTKFKIFLEMIKFEHTVFALPFAFMGAILGSWYYGHTAYMGADRLDYLSDGRCSHRSDGA